MCSKHVAGPSLWGHMQGRAAVELTSLAGKEPGRPPQTEQWKDPIHTDRQMDRHIGTVLWNLSITDI